jgi:hypothetical protein
LEDPAHLDFGKKIVTAYLAAPLEEGGAMSFDFVNREG